MTHSLNEVLELMEVETDPEAVRQMQEYLDDAVCPACGELPDCCPHEDCPLAIA